MKTSLRIMHAMLELLDDYSYDQITITMITERVPIARQGFYKFYRGKEDLCRQMYLYFTNHAAKMDREFTLYEFISHDLTEINSHRVFFYKLAWQPYEKDLFGILHDNIYQIYAEMIRFRTEAELSDELAFLLDGYIIGCLHKLLSVLKKGEPLKITSMTNLCIEMMPQGVRSVLEQGKYPPEIVSNCIQ